MQSRRNSIYALLILILLTGLFTGRAFFFNLAYLLGGLLLISLLWSLTAVRWIGISRKTRARRAQVGRNLDEVFTVQNRAILPKLWLEVRDESDLPGHHASHVVPALGAKGSYRWYVETPCLVRGEFRLGPMTLMSGDPFGLFLSPRKLGATSRVIVYPGDCSDRQDRTAGWRAVRRGCGTATLAEYHDQRRRSARIRQRRQFQPDSLGEFCA